MSVPEIDVDGLVAARRSNHALLDVREPNEYASGHVPGAKLIPLGQLADRVAEVRTDVDLYVICHSGARSAHAVELLGTQGVAATNIAGGTAAWIQAGHAVVTGDQPE